MKKSLFTQFQKTALLTVPAAALMLGAANAQTTIAMNFAAWYYDSGTTPQTIGYGKGYQTTGWQVTAAAFGVPAANWYGTLSPDLLNANFVAIANTYTFGPAGALSATLNAPGVWQTGIGEISPVSGKFVAGTTVSPGNDQVTWNYLFGDTNTAVYVDISGLSAVFPNGYAIQTIAARDGVVNFNGVGFTDTITTTHADYSTYYEANPVSDGYRVGGTIGISGPSGTFPGTSDTIEIDCDPETAASVAAGSNSVLSAFIITDVPVVTRNVQINLLVAASGSFILPTPSVVGIGLTYQWQHAGTNLSGATFSTYTNNSAATTDSGLYQVVVTSTNFPSLPVTAQVASVAVVPTHSARTATWDANTAVTGAQDGSGIWSNTSTNWWSGSFDDYWGSADSAVFGAGGTGAYTVTLGDFITANSITFNSGVYTLTNSSSQTLTLSGLPALIANTNGTITVPVSVATNSLVTAGTGAVTLSGGLTCTNVIVGAGTLQVLSKSVGDASYVISNAATLKLGYSTGGGYANTAMNLNGNGASATTGLYLKGGSTYNVSGGVVVNGAPTTIRQYGSGYAGFGIFDWNSNPGLSISAAASGSTTDPNIEMVNDGYGMVVTTAAGANTATGDLTINGPLNVSSSNDGQLHKRGTGSLRLNGAAAPGNNKLVIDAGTVICGVAKCIGSNATVIVSAGGTLNLNGTSQTVTNATLAGTLEMTINKGGSPNCSTLTCSSGQGPTLSGTLVVTNIGGALAIGDTFTLFPVVGSGAFSSLQLPQANGLAWQDNTAGDGSIQVIAGSAPPSLTTDLVPATTNYAYAGGSCSFAITATGDPILQYQWRKNGATVVGSNPTLTLSSVTTGSAGYYSCTVTNNFGQAQSQTNYLVVVSPASAGLEAVAQVQDAPNALWPLAETGPSTAYDYLGSHNGTQSGGLTLGVPGPQPPAYAGFTNGTLAYQFDGSSSYIDLGTNVSLGGATDFTLEAWINTTNTTSGDILAQRSNAGYDGTANGFNGEYELTVNGNGTVSFYVYGGGFQFNFSSPISSKYLNDGAWHHIVAVRSGLSGIIYIDGSAVASASGSTVAPLDSTIATFIGVNGRGFNTYFNGSLCDVAIYNYALSPVHIAEHAMAGVLGTSPFRLREVAGGFLQDSKPSGTPHPGVNYGTTWQYTNIDNNSVTRTNVAYFPSHRQIVIPPNADFNGTNGTMCFWMRLPTTPAAGTGCILVDRRLGGGGATGMVVVLDGTPSGGIDIQYNGNATFTTGGSLTDGNWHHVAITYDQSASGTVTVYIDGTSVGSQVNTAAWSWVPSQQIELGRSHDTYWQYYNGLMADFRIYSRILTATEVGTIVSGNALVDTTTLMVRYNFDTAAGVGTSLLCPVGALQSASALAPANWTVVSNINTQLPYLTPAGLPVTTNTTLFYRGGF